MTRSRSLGRARKRQEGMLLSQQPMPDEQVEGRWKSIGEALESNAVWSRGTHAAWPDCDAWRPKSMFDLYFKLQHIVERWEWEKFSDALRVPLPITFRFVKGDDDPAFRAQGERLLEQMAKWGSGTRRLGLVDGWQLHLDKGTLRDAAPGSELGELREWLIRGT